MGVSRADGLCEGTHRESEDLEAGDPSRRLPLWIEGGLQNEFGIARVLHVGQNQAIARMIEVEETSPQRRDTMPCARWTPDSPCRLMHLNESAQRDLKSSAVRVALDERGFEGSLVTDCVPAPSALGWRSKVSFIIARDGSGAIRLGAFRRGTHYVQPMVDCPLPEPALQGAAQALEQALGLAAISLANPKLRVAGDTSCGRPADDWSGRPGPRSERWLVEDGLRYVMMRSNAAGEVAVLLLSPSGRLAFAEGLAQSLIELAPQVVSVSLGASGEGNTIVGEADATLLAGTALFQELIGEASVDIRPPSFFQVHRDAATTLQQRVVSLVLPGPALDLYSGVGAIALRIAAKGQVVHGVDSVAASVDRAIAGAEQAGLSDHATFDTADCKSAVISLAENEKTFSTVILNPPRRGCDPEVLLNVQRLGAQRLLYISCNPKSLARDAALLRDQGFMLREATPHDLFPHSEHVETIAIFDKEQVS